MNRSIGLCCVAAIGVAIACLLMLGGDDAGATPGIEDVWFEDSAPETVERADTESVDDAASRERVETPPQPQSTAPVGGPEGRVSGTIVVVDAEGVEHPEEDGEIKFVLWTANSGSQAKVVVRGGRFSFDPDEDVRIEVSDATLGGRRAYVPGEHEVTDGVIRIRAVWPGRKLLRVVDADSGVDLDGVVAIASTDWKTDDCEHPGHWKDADLRIEGERSPCELKLPAEQKHWVRWEETLWVRSPGYAWGRLKVNYASALERRVELRRGGGLAVQVTGEKPKSDTVLRLRRVHVKQPILEMPLKMGERLIEGLAPGPYLLSAEQGNWWKSPLELVRQTVEVTIGARAPAVLQVLPRPDKATVPFAGALFLPPAWKTSRLSLRFEPIGRPGVTDGDEHRLDLSSMEPDPAKDGLYRWDLGDVVPGKYEVVCYAIDMQWVIDTGPAGRRDAEIVIGEPVDAAVRVIDDATGAAVEGATVHWNCERPQGVSGGSLGTAKWNKDTQRYEFRVAAGGVRIAVWSREYRTIGDTLFQVDPHQREFEIRVARNCGIILSLWNGGAVVPWDDKMRWGVDLSAIGGKGSERGSGGVGDHGQYVTVSEPGVYRVKIPTPAGFEPIEPFEVEIGAGEFVEKRVELRSK